MGLARKHIIRTSIAAATLAALVTPALSAGAAWSGPSVKVTSPTMGASVAGVVNLVSDGGAGTYAGWNPVNVTFQVDGVNLGSATAHTTAGWSIAWDSTKVADGFHQIAATAYGAKGRSYRSASSLIRALIFLRTSVESAGIVMRITRPSFCGARPRLLFTIAFSMSLIVLGS